MRRTPAGRRVVGVVSKEGFVAASRPPIQLPVLADGEAYVLEYRLRVWKLGSNL